MKFKKQTQNFFILFLILTIFSFSLSGCSDNKEEEKLKEKLASEMEYMDTKIINMLNTVNGIIFKNYIVTSEKIQDQDTDMSSKSESSSNDSSQSSSNGDSSSSQGGQSSGGQESSGDTQNNKNNVQYKMEISNILSKDRKTDWQQLKSDIEGIYSSWAIITLDLYNQKIDSQNILNFNKDLDMATKAIQAEDKTATLTSLSKLYSYIPIYTSNFLQDSNKINIYKTKSNLLNAYAIVEQNNPDEVNKQLLQAEENFRNLVNNIGNDTKNQGAINKTYIMIKDIQNSVSATDADVFYVKYKNLMEELNILD